MSKHECVMCGLVSDLDGSADLHGALAVLLRYVAAQLGVHAADVLLYDAGARKFQYGAGRGFRTRTFESSPTRLLLAIPIIEDRKIIRNPDLTRMKNEWGHSRELTDEGFVAYVGLPLIASNQLVGVLEVFHREHLNPNAGWLATAEDIAEHGAIAINHRLTVRAIKQSNDQLALAYDETIQGWARTMELRDYEPQGHTERITNMTLEFARVLGIGEAELVHMRRGALLHDVGMMGVPDEVLLKVTSLSEAEWAIIRRHPVIAYEQLSPIEFLHPALDIPYCHHEKWDGTGYPRGLAGEQIPLAARLFAIVDTWDSLRSNRPYRKGWPEAKVHMHIRERGGKQFDPKLAEMFVKLLETDNPLRREKTGADKAVLRSGYQENKFKI